MTTRNLALLWQEYVNTRSAEVRNKLASNYLPLVWQIAVRIKRKLPPKYEVYDLFQEGIFGLMDAIKGFDPMKGTKFLTRAYPRIRGAMIDSLRRDDWVPRTRRRVGNVSEMKNAPEHFDASDTKTPEPWHRMSRNDGFQELISCLNRRSRALIILRYRFGWAMCKIGKFLGLSKSRANQLHQEIKRHIQKVVLRKIKEEN